MPDNYRYYAFISYRHADNKEQGRQWATWLHQAIETYEVPADLVGQKNERGEEIPSRIYPIFRDEEELPAHADLGATIVRALEETRLLIVLCSPRAVASTYVAEEIDYFKKLGRSNAIIAAMIDGEPNAGWDEGKLAAGFTVEDECFPLPLQFEYDEQGNRTTKRAEPIAADFRINNDGQPEQGWTSPEAYRQHLQTTNGLSGQQIQKKLEIYQKQQHLMLMKIIAGILGVPLGELTQRDKEYQLEQARLKAKRLRQWLSVVAALAVLAVGAGITAYFKQVEAIEQRNIAEQNEKQAKEEKDKALISQSDFLLSQAKQENDKGHYDTALLLELNALPGPYGGERPKIKQYDEIYRSIVNSEKKAVLPHKNAVEKISYSPDGKLLLTKTSNLAIIWSVSDGKKLHTFNHKEYVSDLAFSNNGKMFATSSLDQVTIWSINGSRLVSIKYDWALHNVKFSPDDKLLVATTGDGKAIIWSTANGEKITAFPGDTNITPEFTNDGKALMTLSPDSAGTAVLWSIPNRQKLQTFEHSGELYDFDLSPDNSLLLTASNDKTATLWSVDSGKKKYELPFKSAVLSVTFTPNGENALIFPLEEHAILWAIKNKKTLHKFKKEYNSQTFSFSHDGNVIIDSGENHSTILSLLTGKTLKTISKHGIFSPDGKSIAKYSDNNNISILSTEYSQEQLSLENDGNISFSYAELSPDDKSILTITDHLKLWTLNKSEPSPHTFKPLVSKATFSPDGSTILGSHWASPAFLWSAKDGDLLHEFHNSVVDANYSSDGSMIITSSQDNTAAVWSTQSGKLLNIFKPNNPIKKSTFSPDGKKMLILPKTDNAKASLWDIETGNKMSEFEHQCYAQNAKFSPGGDTLTIGCNWNVIVFHVDSGNTISSFNLDYEADIVEFSPDSKTIFTSSRNETADIWSATSGERLNSFIHKGPIWHAAFSADGEKLVTSSSDRTATIWDVASGAKLHTINHDSSVDYSTFNKAGDRLISASNSIKVFNLSLYKKELDIKTLTTSAIEALPHNRSCLTPAERKKYFLADLTDEQWIERGCPQFTRAARAENSR